MAPSRSDGYVSHPSHAQGEAGEAIGIAYGGRREAVGTYTAEGLAACFVKSTVGGADSTGALDRSRVPRNAENQSISALFFRSISRGGGFFGPVFSNNFKRENVMCLCGTFHCFVFHPVICIVLFTVL